MPPGQSPQFASIQAELENVKDEFHQLLASIPDEDWNRKIPGEHWTAKQELVHVAQALQTIPGSIQRATTGHGGALMALTPVALRNWANGYILIPVISRKATRDSITAEYEKAHADLVDLLGTLPDEAWSKGAKYGEYMTVEQMAHHPREHLAEHSAHLRQVLHLEGAAGKG
jgi:DinB superfamily